MENNKSFGPILSAWVKVIQDINPACSWWLTSLRQVGFININHMRTAKPEVEQTIVTEAASYGKQLGRIIDALSVLCSHSQLTDLDEAEKKALKDLAEMATEIAATKARSALTMENVKHLKDCLRHLDNFDQKSDERVSEALSKMLMKE